MQLPNSSALAGMLADLARFEVALSDLEQLTQQGQIRSDDGSPERHSGESTELRSEQRQEGQIPTSGATGTAEMQEELHRVRDADKDWKG